ncbi:MAG: hypothetical protein AB1400_05465 [Pseudomonadota bacterium]
MALEAIDPDSGITVAALTEAIIGADDATGFGAGVTFNTIGQFVLAAADALTQGFVALMAQQAHVIVAHEFRVVHALTAFAYIQFGL